ncbi:MAG: hypothetical protein Pars2KO_00770 [Parasphingorhabdus sp.]
MSLSNSIFESLRSLDNLATGVFMFRIYTVGVAAAVGFLIAAPLDASLNDQFRCDAVGDGEHLVILSGLDSNKATVQYQINKDGAVSKSPSVTELTAVYRYPESGARYAGGEYVLLLTNNSAVLLFGIGNGQEGHTECTFVGGDYDASNPEAIKINVPAKSWGGKLRAGPGMNFEQVGSLKEGDLVTLIENTGVMMNGYPWFRLNTVSGNEGFQWGGIICATTEPVEGVFDTCE